MYVTVLRYIKDVIYLMLITVLIPLFVLSYFYIAKKSDASLYDFATLTFVVGIIFFHLFCYVRKGTASPQLPRLIDYIYVFSAVIGLSGTAVEADRMINVNTYPESVRLSKLNLNMLKDEVNMAAENCTKNSGDAQCTSLNSIVFFIKSKLPDALSSSDLEKIKAFTYEVDTYLAVTNNLSQEVRNKISRCDKTIQSLYTASVPQDIGLSWKILITMFIPSAIALRITKISVEIFGWFPKA